MAVAFVQKIDSQFTSSSTTRTLTLPSSTTAGDLLVVAVAGYFGSTITSVADNYGNTYTLAKNTTTNPGLLSLWYAPNIAGGASHAVTVTTDTTFGLSMSALEYSGAATSTPVVGFVAGTGTTANPTDSGGLAATAGDLLIGILAEASGGALTAGSGWTARTALDDSVTFALGVEDRAATGGSDHSTWSLASTPSSWSATLVGFKQATGDTTPPVVASADVNAAGTTLTIHFTEAGSPPVLPASGVTGFTLNATGGAVTLSSTAISSTTFTATTSRPIQSGETLTLDYAPGNVTDSAGSPNSLAGFTGTSVTNNSTATGLAAGAASFDSCGPAGGSAFVKMTATDASGGTPSYTYQWKRNTDGGSYSNLTNGGGVSGATTKTLTDGSAVAGHLYGYKLVYTDSASATVTSAAVTAQVYTGGALSGGGTANIFTGSLVR